MKNCWTCRHNSHLSECLLLIKAGDEPNTLIDAVGDWVVANCDASKKMPERDADGCPGYEPDEKQRALTIARDTIAAFEAVAQHIAEHGPPKMPDHVTRFIPTPTLPHNPFQAPPRTETEADVPRAPERDWSGDDDGRDIG